MRMGPTPSARRGDCAVRFRSTGRVVVDVAGEVLGGRRGWVCLGEAEVSGERCSASSPGAASVVSTVDGRETGGELARSPPQAPTASTTRSRALTGACVRCVRMAHTMRADSNRAVAVR